MKKMADSNKTTELHQQPLRCSDLAKMLGSKHRCYRRQTMAKGSKNNMRLFCTKNPSDKEILYAAYCKKNKQQVHNRRITSRTMYEVEKELKNTQFEICYHHRRILQQQICGPVTADCCVAKTGKRQPAQISVTKKIV